MPSAWVPRLVPLALAALLGTARADEPADAAPPPQGLSYNLAVDLSITFGGAALFVLSDTLLKDALATDTCRWCEPPGFDARARDALRWDNTESAHAMSNWFGFGLVPAAAFGLLAVEAARADRLEQWWVDALIVAESMVVASIATQAVKLVVGRERPWIHALPEDEKPLVERPDENNVSFFSGHTSFAVSVATAAGTVAARRGYRTGAVLAVTLPLALASGYHRIAADKHWTSDVVVGAAIGAAAGYLVPRLHYGPAEVKLAPGGATIAGTF